MQCAIVRSAGATGPSAMPGREPGAKASGFGAVMDPLLAGAAEPSPAGTAAGTSSASSARKTPADDAPPEDVEAEDDETDSSATTTTALADPAMPVASPTPAGAADATGSFGAGDGVAADTDEVSPSTGPSTGFAAAPASALPEGTGPAQESVPPGAALVDTTAAGKDSGEANLADSPGAAPADEPAARGTASGSASPSSEAKDASATPGAQVVPVSVAASARSDAAHESSQPSRHAAASGIPAGVSAGVPETHGGKDHASRLADGADAAPSSLALDAATSAVPIDSAGESAVIQGLDGTASGDAGDSGNQANSGHPSAAGGSAPDAPSGALPAAGQPGSAGTQPGQFSASAAATLGHATDVDDPVVPQLVKALHLQLRNGVGEARVQLEPHHLGAVSVALRVENGVVSAVITAEQPAVRHWLETHESSLRGALSGQGLQLDRLRVEADGQQSNGRASTGQEPPPRRRTPRNETATFELVA